MQQVLKVVMQALAATTLLAGAPASWAEAAAPGSVAIMGFDNAHGAAERRLEERFQALPSAGEARRWHRLFSAEPHPAASEQNNRLAARMAAEWRRQGWEEVTLRRYDVLHSAPRSVTLEMTAPTHYRAALREDAVGVDKDSSNPAISSAYFGYSASGDVTAEVIYAHSGNPEDYDWLRTQGITVKGKIVLVRYSNPYSYRGFKALTAEREGAAALLIYSDPADDGEGRGKVFPDGPWGPASHIQRGAITYDFIVPGDPTTPGWASVPGARRIKPEEARSLPKIMALPLSWRDARPLLEGMTGPQAPAEWRGGLPITYRINGAVVAHVHVDMDTSIRPYTVVEARIRGAELPDEWVLVGNHRDAWAFGGVDPVSGTASMMELTRSLGALKKEGHRPRRTIIVCSWDGEEYALTGSTEWGEQFAEELRHKLVAYLNVDESVAGASTTAGPEGLRFEPAAVASLGPMLIEATHDVRAPSGRSLYEAWRATTMRDTKASAPPADASLVETRIGSGSDHTVFLNHLGRPVINLGFTGDYGVYHSGYDDHYWMEHIGDPSFEYHTALTRIWGLTALRLANAELLPFDFAANADALETFLRELEVNSHLDGANVRLADVHDRIARFREAGEALRTLTLRDLAAGHATAGGLQHVNEQLLQVESNWLDPAGIPGRPWFQHILYSSRYTYAHLEFPGLTEAVEAGRWSLATEQADVLTRALERNTTLLRTAATDWGAAH